MELVELVIVGAGWSGLTMAKTYHGAYPDATIRILDSANSIGGSWAAERVYPSLNTNNVLGSYEFSDFPMTPELCEVQPGNHIPGEGVHRYLCAAAEHFGISQYLRLRTKVETARLRDDGIWELSVSSPDSSRKEILYAKKLVVATGLTSEPSMPTFEGQDKFRGLLIHSKELKANTRHLERAQNVVVLGGNKSAWDVCYAVARGGATAHMVMRPSGNGPSWVWPKKFSFFGLTTNLSKLSLTRLWTLYDPWPFAKQGRFLTGMRNFLHCSFLGRLITKLFWNCLGRHIRIVNRYAEHPQTARLAPWTSTYWMGNSLSTHNYPSDWFELVRQGNVLVHHAEVVSLSRGSVTLTEETIENVDAVVCCTGWEAEPTIDFEPLEVRDEIGCPSSGSLPDVMSIETARQQIFSVCPDLNVPASSCKHSSSAQYSLYRFIEPPSERFISSRNLAFIGMGFSLHTVLVAQAQALWITAFFNNLISDRSLKSDQVRHETVLMTEYERLRRPGGAGEKFPDLVFDSLPYIDMLLGDLQLRTRRKSGIWAEMFEAYGVRDYTGLVEEWKQRVVITET